MKRDPRDEAERLVTAAMGMLSAGAHKASNFATGSPECCVCPVCKAIAAARDPDPEFAEKLSAHAAEFANGLSGLLRAFGGATTPPAASSTAGEPAKDKPKEDPGGDAWHRATREAQ
jgi:hypothetical protein